MDITLKRFQYGPEGIFSTLTDEHGNQVAVAAEHAYSVDSTNWAPKIPAGKYICKRRKSPHFGYDLFLVLNVPGHNYCEIHIGNFPQTDSVGCILLGREVMEYEGREAVTESRLTFQNFMTLQDEINEFYLTVLDADLLTESKAA